MMKEADMASQKDETIAYILKKIEEGTKLTKEQGFAQCRALLKEVCCRTVIIKVSDDCKKNWFFRNLERLQQYDPEIALDRETTYIANIMQPVWLNKKDDLPIYANSIGQRMRDEKTIEDISKYPIEWMMII